MMSHYSDPDAVKVKGIGMLITSVAYSIGSTLHNLSSTGYAYSVHNMYTTI